MILARLPHERGTLVDFYQEGLEHLGAICERSWFDRLHLIAEGRAARLWNTEGTIHEAELHFSEPDATAPRDAACEVFPGCPLTFRLAEALIPACLTLERAVLASDHRAQPPSAEVAERLWRAEWPGGNRWRMQGEFQPVHHFSLVSLIRCEIQAIDQHWSLHRLAASLPGGGVDEALAAGWDFVELASEAPADLIWPGLDASPLRECLEGVLEVAMAGELDTIRRRQENHLRRELDRIDNYFTEYERELAQRAARSHAGSTKIKAEERLTAARAEHLRRRADQVQRHEIRVMPRVDALLIVAEPAWHTTVIVAGQGEAQQHAAHFVPRNRRWFREL